MAQILTWLALGLSGAALAHALARAPRSGGRAAVDLTPYLACAGGVLLLGALLTLPTGKPWSPGQTLAPGVVLGGLVVILAALLGRTRPAPGDAEGSSAPFFQASGQVAAATVAVSILLALYPGRVLDPLVGCALGAVAAALLIAGGLRLAHPAASEEDGTGSAAAAEMAALFTVALAGTTFLSAYHHSPAGVREWLPLPVLLGAALAVCLAARGAIPARETQGGIASLAVVLFPLFLMAALIAWRLNGTAHFFWAALIGLGVYGLVAWLDRIEAAPAPATAGEREQDGGARAELPGGTSRPWRFPARADLGLLTSLLVLGGSILAFRELRGYGLGVALLAGIAAGMGFPSQSGEAAKERPLFKGALTLGLLVLLYRVFAQDSDYRRSLEPDFLYYYVALVLGALWPAFLAGSLRRWMREAGPVPAGGDPAGATALPALLRAGLAGLAALTTPLALWLLVGERPQAAFLVGLAVGAGFLLAGPAASRTLGGGGVEAAGAAERPLARLMSLGMALSAIQFTFLLSPLELRTRKERVLILAGVGIAALVWVGVTSVLDARRRKPLAPGD
jgi:hypothetical protein